jgi:hypothetical protein
VLYGDGNVNFLGDNVSLAVWRAIGTRASAETPSSQ